MLTTKIIKIKNNTKIINMKNYNFFYRGYIRNEDGGVAVDHFFPESSTLQAKETYTYKMLSEYLEAGIVVSFGWTEVIPYEVN